MKLYRIFLLQQDKIVTSHDFRVENDDWACRVAALVFDACTERCDHFELWEGSRLAATADGLKTRADVRYALTEAAQAEDDGAASDEAIARGAVAILEAAMQNSGALRASARLQSRLDTLRTASSGSPEH